MTLKKLTSTLLGSAGMMVLLAGAAYAQDEEAAPTGPAAVYDDQCTRCHGEDGQAGTRMGDRYGVEPFTQAKLDELGADGIRDALVNGREDMDPVEGVEGADLDALVEYVQGLAQ